MTAVPGDEDVGGDPRPKEEPHASRTRKSLLSVEKRGRGANESAVHVLTSRLHQDAELLGPRADTLPPPFDTPLPRCPYGPSTPAAGAGSVPTDDGPGLPFSMTPFFYFILFIIISNFIIWIVSIINCKSYPMNLQYVSDSLKSSGKVVTIVQRRRSNRVRRFE